MPDFHRFIVNPGGWETVESRQAYTGPHLEVREVKVRTPSRPQIRSWTEVHRKGAVVVVPMTHDGKVLLVRQERVPIRRAIWELPAGQIDENQEHSDEVIRSSAARELREETGFELAPDAQLTSLGYFFPSAGFTDEHSYLFLARPVIKSSLGQQHDENEVITECRGFTVEQWRQMIAAGEICDANTMAAFSRLVTLGLI